jgi:hypothetical protein
MPAWTRVRETFVEADRTAFGDVALIQSHFGFPLPHPERVFSSSLDAEGRSGVHAPGKQFRPQNFGNAMAMRLIKAQDPAAWIWDERYHFARDPMPDRSMVPAQEAFLTLFGDERLSAVQARAKAVGLVPRVHAKGRPDLATFSEGWESQWRFIEIKILGGQDKLNPDQVNWLEVIGDVLGRASAIELEFLRVTAR